MAAKNKEEGVDSHPEVQSPQGPLEAQFSGDRALGGGGGCQGDLKYRFATILSKSAPRAERGEGVNHSKSSVAQVLKWKTKKQRKVLLRDRQAEE